MDDINICILYNDGYDMIWSTGVNWWLCVDTISGFHFPDLKQIEHWSPANSSSHGMPWVRVSTPGADWSYHKMIINMGNPMTYQKWDGLKLHITPFMVTWGWFMIEFATLLYRIGQIFCWRLMTIAEVRSIWTPYWRANTRVPGTIRFHRGSRTLKERWRLV